MRALVMGKPGLDVVMGILLVSDVTSCCLSWSLRLPRTHPLCYIPPKSNFVYAWGLLVLTFFSVLIEAGFSPFCFTFFLSVVVLCVCVPSAQLLHASFFFFGFFFVLCKADMSILLSNCLEPI